MAAPNSCWPLRLFPSQGPPGPRSTLTPRGPVSMALPGRHEASGLELRSQQRDARPVGPNCPSRQWAPLPQLPARLHPQSHKRKPGGHLCTVPHTHSVSKALSPCLPAVQSSPSKCCPRGRVGRRERAASVPCKGHSFSANGFSPGQKRCMHLQQERGVPGGDRDLLVMRGGGKDTPCLKKVGSPCPCSGPAQPPGPGKAGTHPWKRLLFVQGALGLQG